MRRLFLSSSVVLCFSVVLALPALGGELIEGDGYEIRLPPGFTEVMSVENAGNMRVTSGCAKLPVDGMPELKAYIAGASTPPDGILMLARINLTRKITTSDELGLNQIEQIKEHLPEGADVRATNVAGHDALEMTIHHEQGGIDHTSRVMSIAAGDYVVVVMLTTSDETFADSAGMWAAMTSSMSVEPGFNKLILFGLVGAAGLFGLWMLNRVSSRTARDTTNYTGRFRRDQDGAAGADFAPRDEITVGRRPQVLASRPPADMPEPGRLSRPQEPATPVGAGASGGFAPDGAAAPVRTPTSPAVTRPRSAPPPGRPGLRRTLPETGRWGE